MQCSNSADNSPIISRSAARSTIRDALRLYIGRGRRYSVKQVSNATGVKDRVFECAMCDPDDTDYRPLPLEALLSVAAFLGADFTSEWLMLAQQGAFDLPDADAPPPGAIAADNAEDNAAVTRAAIDGEFDGQERKLLRPVGLRMVARGQQLVKLSAVA